MWAPEGKWAETPTWHRHDYLRNGKCYDDRCSATDRWSPPSAPQESVVDRAPASGTGGSEALRRFEQRLIPARTTAGQVEAWEAYAKEWLPNYGTDPTATYSQIDQGFAAGYDAAMSRIRGILVDVQSEILRENR